jgi:hypothetical protein
MISSGETKHFLSAKSCWLSSMNFRLIAAGTEGVSLAQIG